MIYVFCIRTNQAVELTPQQEQALPPASTFGTGEVRPLPAGISPQEIAEAWCDFWRRRGYRYEPITEDGRTPSLFEENKYETEES